MNLEGANVYVEGVGLKEDAEEKIRQIVTTLKALTPTPEIGIRFVKNGRMIEGLLWGSAKEVPIGIYNRGPSLNAVLESIQRKVKRECSKIKNNTCNHRTLEMAG